VFENRVLRGIFGRKVDEVTGGWRKLHDEELHNLYFSLNFVRIIKSRRMRWAGHVARMEDEKCVQNFGCLMGILHEEGQDVDERTILKCILGK
jgi:hypothetical protein